MFEDVYKDLLWKLLWILQDFYLPVQDPETLSSFKSLQGPEIRPEMHVNEIHLPHNRHHKVSSLMKFHQNTQNYITYEVYENV